MRKNYYHKELGDRTGVCHKCGRAFESIMLKDARPQDLPPPETTYAGGGVIIRREAVGVMIVGDCICCGLVKSFPMGKVGT